MPPECLEELPGFGNLLCGMLVILGMTGVTKYFSDGLELAECQPCCSRVTKAFCQAFLRKRKVGCSERPGHGRAFLGPLF